MWYWIIFGGGLFVMLVFELVMVFASWQKKLTKKIDEQKKYNEVLSKDINQLFSLHKELARRVGETEERVECPQCERMVPVGEMADYLCSECRHGVNGG